jgi:hypothetical protein
MENSGNKNKTTLENNDADIIHYIPYFTLVPMTEPFGLTLEKLYTHELHHVVGNDMSGKALLKRSAAPAELLKVGEWTTLREYWDRLQEIVNTGATKDFKKWCWPLSSEQDVVRCAKSYKGAKVIVTSRWNPLSGQEEAMNHDKTINGGKNHVVEYLESFFMDEISREKTHNYFSMLGSLTFTAVRAKP